MLVWRIVYFQDNDCSLELSRVYYMRLETVNWLTESIYLTLTIVCEESVSNDYSFNSFLENSNLMHLVFMRGAKSFYLFESFIYPPLTL